MNREQLKNSIFHLVNEVCSNRLKQTDGNFLIMNLVDQYKKQYQSFLISQELGDVKEDNFPNTTIPSNTSKRYTREEMIDFAKYISFLGCMATNGDLSQWEEGRKEK